MNRRTIFGAAALLAAAVSGPADATVVAHAEVSYLFPTFTACSISVCSDEFGANLISEVGSLTATATAGGAVHHDFNQSTYSAIWEVINPLSEPAWFQSFTADYTFENSDNSVTAPGEQGFITASFDVPFIDEQGNLSYATESGDWLCTLTSCDRPDIFGFGSGSWNIGTLEFFQPGEGFQFIIAGEVSASAVALPEPGTMTMCSLGLISFLLTMRRRRKSGRLRYRTAQGPLSGAIGHSAQGLPMSAFRRCRIQPPPIAPQPVLRCGIGGNCRP